MAYRINPDVLARECQDGPNIAATPFGLIDTLVSSVDLRPLVSTTSEYTSFPRTGLRNRRRSTPRVQTRNALGLH